MGQPCWNAATSGRSIARSIAASYGVVRLLGVEQVGKFAVRGETIDFTEESASLGELWVSGGSTGRLYMSPKRDRPTRTRLLEVSVGSTSRRGGVNAPVAAQNLTALLIRQFASRTSSSPHEGLTFSSADSHSSSPRTRSRWMTDGIRSPSLWGCVR